MIYDEIDCIYILYPNVTYTRDGIAYDKNDNIVEIDNDLVLAKVAEMQARQEAKIQAAQDKLAKLGLTPEDLKALLG